jgi:hypothetical protein
MAWLANSLAAGACFFAGVKEMIGPTVFRDFRAFSASGAIRVLGDFVDGRFNEPGILLNDLRTEVVVRPGQNGFDVAARLGGDDELHGSTAGVRRGLSLGLKLRHELLEGFFVLDDNALALIEFVEPLFGGVPKRF